MIRWPDVVMGTIESTVAVPEDWSPPAAFEEYRLLQPLGRGAMGQVYLARDTLLDRLVAVKFIATRVPEDDARRERFQVEARAIARLQHPNVVMIHRVGHVQRQPFLVYEYIRGQPLDRIARPLPWQRVLEIAVDLARGLGAAHRRGIVHRDIKPANVMITEEGAAKLLDFGVAKLLDFGAPQLPVGDPPAHPTEAPTSPTGELADTLQNGAGDRLQHPTRTAASRTGDLVGTPLYAAPEVWQGEPATRRSDVYSLGVLLHELCAGRLPHADAPFDDIRRLVTSAGLPPLGEIASVEPRLAAIIDRCLALDPAERFDSGDAVREALESLATPARPAIAPDAAPYRGLRSFEAEHRDLFFARDRDVRSVLDRLRAGGFVLVAGDSGVGKSSLLAAGVLPALADGSLEPGHRFEVVRLVPGRQPLSALARALAPALAPMSGGGEAALARALVDEPAAAVRSLRRALGPSHRLALCIDQLEELVTLAAPEEAAQVAEVLCELAGGGRELCLLAAVRADFLVRVVQLSRLRDELPRALYLLEPLDRGALREAVVGPCRALGWSFESEAMIDALVDGAGGSAPLLQFALEALWQARDRQRRIIPAAALQALGGVSGALARHADGVLAHLLPPQRAIARRVLSRLVTAEGTMSRRGEEDLLGEAAGRDETRAVLEALVRGRLLVARASEHGGETSYELVHEALLTAWGTLRDWLDGEAEARVARQRVERAAAEWERLGHPSEALLRRRQLVELAAIDEASLGPREQAFVRRSRSTARRRRALMVAAVLALPLTATGAWGGSQLVAVRARDRQIAVLLAEAGEAWQRARNRDPEIDRLRQQSFAAFYDGRSADGERGWAQALAAGREQASGHGRARQALQRALVLDGTRRDLRRRFAELLYDGALAAERDRRLAEMADLLEQLQANDLYGELTQRWQAPAHLTVRASPADTQISIQRYDSDPVGRRQLSRSLETATGSIANTRLPPGSYLVMLVARGRPAIRYPLVLGRDERQRVELTVPTTVPDGFVYVPPGRFLFGSADEELVRRTMLPAEPLHPVVTNAYLIQRTEVTFRQWIDFLDTLPPADRDLRRPRAHSYFGTIDLSQSAEGRWQLTFEPPSVAGAGTPHHRVEEGQPLRYRDRTRRTEQDWLDFPVTGISFNDALAYVAWLARSGRVPGARLCDRHEWERAARGADDRIYPHGDQIDGDDVNIDITYGQRSQAFGPDAVGSHPASNSPFDVADMCGNALEWMAPAAGNPIPLNGGGDFWDDVLTARSNNRRRAEPGLRSGVVGMRVCADVSPPP